MAIDNMEVEAINSDGEEVECGLASALCYEESTTADKSTFPRPGGLT